MANWQDELKQYKTAPDRNYDINAYQQQPQTMATGQTMSATAAPQAGYMQIPMANTQMSPQQTAQQGVRTPHVNTPGYQNGQTVDLTSLYGEIGASKPNQQWTLKDLQDKMAADPVNGQKVDLSGLYTQLGKKPGDTFTSDELKTSINNANSIPIQAAKYQDPAQFQALITQMNQVLSPLTQAQKGAAQSAYGQASGQLANKWAANGLLASGGAAAQQQQGANQLAQQMQGIEAQQQANAIPLAQQFANLSLTEDQQKFNQNNTRSQQNVGNMLGALGQQYGQQNAWMGQAQNLAGMDIGQNQWAQQFGAQNKQNAVNNQLSGLGLQQNMLQDYLKNYMGTTGMDIGQNQWSQDFGLRKQAQEFSQGMQQAGMDNENQKFNANLGQQQNQQAQQGSQFDRNFAQQGNQFDQKMGLDNKQANGNMALQLSQLFGRGVNPTTDWGNMFDQVQGSNTAQSQNSVMDFLGKMLQSQPFMPNNAGNAIGSQNPNYSNMTDFLNQMGGQASQKTYENQQQMAKWEKEFNFDSGMKARSIALQETNGAQERDYKGYLMNRGISEDNAKKNTNSFLTQVLSKPDRESAVKYITEHDKDIAGAGIKVSDILDGIDSKFGSMKTPTPKAPNSSGSVYDGLTP